MATHPPGQLTRAEIVDPALRRAGNTKASVRADAIAALNDILYDLYTQHPWPFLHTDVDLALVGASFPLPADFWKTVDDASLTITTLGGSPTRRVIQEVDRSTIVTRLPTDSIPQLWHPDRATGVGLLWPQPGSTAVGALLRYIRVPAALTADTDIPVFPWHRYLQHAVFVWALSYEMDPRTDMERVRLNEFLKRILEIAVPLRAVSSVIPLDPHVFGPVFDDDGLTSSWER